MSLRMLLALAAISAAPSLAAAPLPERAASAEGSETGVTLPPGQTVFLELTLNHSPRGAYPIVLQEHGDFLVRRDDLESMMVVPPYGTPVMIEGDEYYSLRDLGATAIHLDEHRLALSAELPAERLPKQSADFLPKHPVNVIRPRDTSAYFNYRLLNSLDETNDSESWVMGGEIGVRYRDFLFRSESAHVRDDGDAYDIRYGTSLTHDNRDTLRRLIVGDFFASSGNLGSSQSFGGISFSKLYAIDPYFVTQPMAGFVSTITAPSEVDIYLDGSRLRTMTLAPGEFELENLDYYGGRHDVEVVIRDNFGREQHIAYPYYFSDQNLRQGLHDYSYNAGWIRAGAGTPDDSYGDFAASAYHRYGWSDDLTVGMRGEAGAGVFNVGPTAVWRHDRLGVLSGALSGSGSDAGAGWAAAAGYAYQAREFSLYSAWRYYTQDYAIVGRADDAERPRQELATGVGYALNPYGNLGLSLRHSTWYEGPDQESVTLSYSRTFHRTFNVTAALGSTYDGERANYCYVALSYHPGRSLHASLGHQQNGDDYADSFQIGNTLPMGEGWGYRFTADRSVTEFGESERVSPWAQYSGRHGILTASVANETWADSSRTLYQWGVAGGIGYVADSVSFSRPITDSFAVVDVGDLEGVRVYLSSQELGRTDKDGRVFVPNLSSYLLNRVSVDDRDIPIDYSLEAKAVNTLPPLRSGSLIRFDVKRYQAVSGRLLVNVGTVWLPAEFGALNVEVNGTPVTAPMGRSGEFYLENLAPARYRAQIEFRGTRCDFELVVPDSAETIIDVGELNACEISG